MTECPHSPSTDALELRVLSGKQLGARSTVDMGLPVLVGSGLGNDVVLRHSDLGDCKVQLSRHALGVLVEVLFGDVAADGQRIGPGEQAVLPLYRPLSLGKTTVALGQPEAIEWDDLAGEPRAPLPTKSPTNPHLEVPGSNSMGADAAEKGTKPQGPVSGLRTRLMLFLGGVMLTASVGVGAYSYSSASQPLRAAAPKADQVNALLRQTGFSQLNAQTGEDDTLTIKGYVDTSAERAQVEKMLLRAGVVATLMVGVNDRLVSAVQDVFRANQVAADVLAVGPGAVQITAHEADELRLAKVKATALRDIPGLLKLEMNNTPPTIAATPEPVIEDPGKRVASIVPGDVAYVVTADGSRYFEGALLPTGQRITGIEEGQVRLERNGTTTTVRF